MIYGSCVFSCIIYFPKRILKYIICQWPLSFTNVNMHLCTTACIIYMSCSFQFWVSTKVCYPLMPLLLLWCASFISTSKLFLIFLYPSESPSLLSIWGRHLFIPQDDGWFPLKMTLITAQLSFQTPHTFHNVPCESHTQASLLSSHIKVKFLSNSNHFN